MPSHESHRPAIAVKHDDDDDGDVYATEDEEEDELFNHDEDDDDDARIDWDSALPPPVKLTRTMGDLHDMIHEGLVDLDAEYQRGVVWPDIKQIKLINSIIHNYTVPKVVFAVKERVDPETGESVEVRVCVDGKQRLTSVQRFMDGLIPYRDPKNLPGKSLYYEMSESSKGKRNRPCHPYDKKRFAKLHFDCEEYYDITEEQERDIFNRVQNGVPLSPAEKLNSIQSEWAELVRDLLHKYILNDKGLGDVIKWRHVRGIDWLNVAQIVYSLYKYPGFTFPSAPTVDSFLRREPPPSDNFRAQVVAIFREYIDLAEDPRYNHVFHGIADRVSSAEMVMIGLLLHHMKGCTPGQKAEQISGLRKATRAQHRDIFMNHGVARTMCEYISNIPGIPGAPTLLVPIAGRKKRKQPDGQAEEQSRLAPAQRAD